MAGHDDRQRVAPVGGPDGTCGPGLPHGRGLLPVAHRLAERDPAQGLPDAQLEFGSRWVEIEVEVPAAPGEVLRQLNLGTIKMGSGR